jgi:hypothetical protein
MVITEDSRVSAANDSAETVTPGRAWWPFVAGVIALFLAVSLLTPGGRHQWAVSIFRQPARYTTLSFQNAAGLPEAANAGSRVHLTFTVANHEGRRIRYAYVVTSTANPVADNVPVVLRRASLSVPAGGHRTEPVTVTARCTSSPCQLQVSLPGHPETIDALLNVHQPKG